jgi:predicted HicB family RNase H-like nuclease
MKIPKDRIAHGKRLSKTMQTLMYDKYLKGYTKYQTKIEEKPLMGEIMQEILDLANYYITFYERSVKLVQDAKSNKSATYLRKQIIKLLGSK